MSKVKHLLLLVLAIGLGLNSLFNPAAAYALSGADWRAGRIIDDSVFVDSNAMSAAQIRDFINSKLPACSDGVTCLRDYHENPTTKANNLNGRPIPSGAIPAYQIIWQAGQDHGINPQVLLATLQKETSLVTMTAPATWRFRTAMGYGCPDSAPCDSEYYGFYNQVNKAAWQFRRYLTYPENYNFSVGTRFIRYHPNSSCGGKNVKIETAATAALYNYTPYQPNQAALDNLYGTGNSCSSYGNRNFWRLFNDWFGSTEGTPLFRIGETAPVYILGSENNYYHIPSYELLKAYGYPLSVPKIASMSSSYISGRTNSGVLPLTARFEGAAVYLIDRGERHWFDSAELIEDKYGFEMGEEALLPSSTALYYPQTDNVEPVIKQYGGPAIYLMEDGKKRQFVDLDAFNSGDPPYSSLPYVRLSADFLDTTPKGNVIVAPGTLFREGSGLAVYLVNDLDSRLYIGSESLMNQYGWSMDNVQSFAPERVDGYTNDGTLGFITKDSAGSVWVVHSGGNRHHLPPDLLASDRFNINVSSLEVLSSRIYRQMQSHGAMKDLLRGEGNSAIYYVENGRLRWVTSEAAMNNLGYSYDDVTVVSNEFLESLPLGSNIN